MTKNALINIIEIYNNKGQAYAVSLLNTGDGFTRDSKEHYVGGFGGGRQYLAIDVNRDSLVDIVELVAIGGTTAQAWLNTDKGFIIGPKSIIGSWGEGRQYLTLDANKDSLIDIIEIYNGNGKAIPVRWPNIGNGFGVGVASSSINDFGNGRQYLTLDANGDGALDIIEVFNYNGNAEAVRWLNTGDGFRGGLPGSTIGGFGNAKQYLTLDANDDGLVDIVKIYNNNGRAEAMSWLNTGDGFQKNLTGSFIGDFTNDGQYLAVDANGDGLVDIIEIYNNNGKAKAVRWLNTGNGFIGGLTESIIGDFGNGRQYLALCNVENIVTTLNGKVRRLENGKRDCDAKISDLEDIKKEYYVEIKELNQTVTAQKNSIQELESNRKSLHVAKTGQKDSIIIDKTARFDKAIVLGTELEQCKNIIHNFNPLEGDILDFTQYGTLSVHQISFKTFTNIKTPTNEIAVSGVKVVGEEGYAVCVYGFDADEFFAPDFFPSHGLEIHDVLVLTLSSYDSCMH